MARRLADNIFLLTTIAGAFIAWLIAFIGACIFRRGVSGGAWWIIVYELLLIVGITAVLVTNTYAHYRLMILTFLAASIAMLTLQLDYALPTVKFSFGYRGGAGAYAAGYIILIMIEFLWVIVFGSEPESYVGRFAPAHYGNSVGIVHHQHAPQHPQPYEMTGDKTILTDSAAAAAAGGAHFGSVNSYPTNATNNHGSSPPLAHPAATASVQPTNTGSEAGQPTMEYKEKVQALHAYQANPDDPNELSFAKGETLDIVDRNGNWWQARKADGSVGIIPSNYVSR
ncbi:hypothetical protein V8B55DRAFT_1535285 [Mucor lusitanicus]|uniref:SH3 domain-containing protein n=1 Tax=Mucor circinelloides f. lusitanicus TaxID=29924 RepID=A0A8H4BEC3_MUCCL|nr:hypothetical protein FB192DRAFT_1381157 [Mucor lusitanicus]